MTCDVDGCTEDTHTNINGISFNRCTQHYLESMSTLRDTGQECQHVSCSDPATETIYLENGREGNLCEDHANMNPDGTPVEGYTPNDPHKFTRPEEGLDA